jgi:hypothetical protein
MQQSLLSVGEAAAALTQQLGVAVRPRSISALFYDGQLRNDLCPLVGGRRLIPHDYLPLVEAALRRRGVLPARAEEAAS